LLLCADAERSYFKQAPIRNKFENYSPSADVKSMGKDGALHGRCSIQVVKQDDYYAFALFARLHVSGKRITATIEAVRLCDDDDKGDCAPMSEPD